MVYNSFGFTGIYILVIIFTAFISIILFNCLLKTNKNILISFIWTVVIIYASRDIFADRNQIYSFLVFLLEVFSLEKLLEEGKKKYFFVLVGLSIVLINVHDTLYPIFFIICMPYLAEIILSRIKILHLKEPYKIEFSNFKNEKYLIILMILCVFIGFFTPLFGTAYTNMIECLSRSINRFYSRTSGNKNF